MCVGRRRATFHHFFVFWSTEAFLLLVCSRLMALLGIDAVPHALRIECRIQDFDMSVTSGKIVRPKAVTEAVTQQ